MSETNYSCDYCQTDEAHIRKKVTVTRKRRGQWFIFENVDAWVCPHCGQRYFDADVAEMMEQHMSATSKPSDARSVTAWAISLPEKAS